MVRRFFDCQLEGELKYSPFELINLYLCLTFQPVHIPEDENQEKVTIRFNCMDTQDYMKVNHSEDCTFGNYDLSEKLIDAKYTNDAIIPFGKNQ